MYPVNLIPKSYPEKRPHLTLNQKHTSSKHTPRIFAPKSDLDKRYRPILASKSYLDQRPRLILNPKCTSPKHTSRIFAPKHIPDKCPRLTLTSKHTPSKRTPRIFAPKHIPDKCPRLTLTSKHTPSKRTPRIFAPKSYPDKRTHLTFNPNSPKHTSRNLDKKGNRRVRAPELFREFRAASIFAHPTLGRGAFPSFVVCLKWAEVSGLRRGRAA